MQKIDEVPGREKLTVELLDKFIPGMFCSGLVKAAELGRDEVLRWVAVRGEIHDWVIYYDLLEMPYEFIVRQGDKCMSEEVIKFLVPCDDEAFALYRMW